MAWLDAYKGAAMLAILGVHAVERTLGGPWWSNPSADWPGLGTRLRQWEPTRGGVWAVMANPVRWMGWLGDLAPALFVLATGFLLVSVARPRPYVADVRQRLLRFLPMYWLAFVGLTVLAGLAGRQGPSWRDGVFWLSLVGFRASPGTVYYGAGAWWYVGFLVQLAFVAPIVVRWAAPSPGATRRLVAALAGSILVKAVLLVLLRHSAELDVVNRGGVIVGKLPELLAGTLLAVLVRDATDERDAMRRLLPLGRSIVLALAGFAAAFTLVGNAVAGVLMAAGCIGIAAATVGAGTSRAARWLRFVSRYSLAIFLAHPIPNQLAVALPFGPQAAARLVATIVLGVASGVALEWTYRTVVDAVPTGTRAGRSRPRREDGLMERFEGRLAVVTGGGTGMGREPTCQLAADGCNVAMCDVSADNMAETKALAEAEAAAGVTVSRTFVADVSDEAQLAAFRDAGRSGTTPPTTSTCCSTTPASAVAAASCSTTATSGRRCSPCAGAASTSAPARSCRCCWRADEGPRRQHQQRERLLGQPRPRRGPHRLQRGEVRGEGVHRGAHHRLPAARAPSEGVGRDAGPHRHVDRAQLGRLLRPTPQGADGRAHRRDPRSRSGARASTCRRPATRTSAAWSCSRPRRSATRRPPPRPRRPRSSSTACARNDWRILVGDDAHILDGLVREDPTRGLRAVVHGHPAPAPGVRLHPRVALTGRRRRRWSRG